MQATQETKESVLVVGSPGVGKYTLIKSLQAEPDVKTSACTYSLTLDTKYYIAEALLRAVGTQHEKLSPGLQALVLVFDASKQSSFESVRSWAERHDTSDIEVRLVVANKSDLLQMSGSNSVAPAAISRPTWLEDAVNWCYEGGFEYIEAAAGQPGIDVQLQLDGEQQGVARVLAALQAHMWPGMVQKAWTPGPLATSAPRLACSAAAGAAAGEASSSTSSSRDQGTAEAGADADAQKAVANGSAAAGQQKQQQDKEQEQQQDEGQQPAAQPEQTQQPDSSLAAQQQQQQQQPPAPGAGISDEGLFSEVDVDDFDKLMQQMQGMRARLSGLPDAERRAAAADMAIKLAALMGLHDDDDDDEGSEGGSEAVEDDGRQQLDVHSRTAL